MLVSASAAASARWIARASGLAALAFVAWLTASGPLRALWALDSPGMLRDFVNIYLDQGQRLLSASPSLHPRWFYPPLSAALMQPFALLGPTLAFWTWLALQLALIAWLVCTCRRQLASLGRATSWAGSIGLCVTSLPIVHGLKWGQVSLLLLLLAVSGLTRSGRAGPWLLGLAASIKLYPALYLLLPALQRRWAFVARSALAWVALGAVLPLLLLGPALTLAFVARSLTAGAALWDDAAKGQTLGAAIERWFHAGVDFGHGVQPWLFSLPEAVRGALTWLLCLGLLALSLRRASQQPVGDMLGAVLVITALSLSIRPGWDHYYAVLPLAQAVALGNARSHGALAAAGLGWCLSAAPLFAFAVRPGLYGLGASLGLLPIAALLSWLGLWLVTARGQAHDDAASVR